MKKSIYSIFCLMTLIANAPLVAKTKPAPVALLEEKLPELKVLIKQDVPGVLLESKGGYVVSDPANGKKLSSSKKSKRFYLHAQQDGLKWGEGFPGIYQLHVSGALPKDTFLIDGIEYEGLISVYDIENQLAIVNQVPIESYLKSFMTEKFDGEHLDMHVLKALAIVLRTQFYYTSAKNKNAFWQVDRSNSTFLGCSNQAIDRYVEEAIDSTKAIILTFNYRPFFAEWTEHSAGTTASFPMIFRKNILSPHGVEAPLARKDKDNTRWTFSMQKSQLAQMVKANRVTAIDTFEDSHSKRIYAVRVKDGNHHLDFDFFAFQKLMGEKYLKSNQFTVNFDQDMVKFEGFGKGHGVGLCLFSANEMAKKGSTVEEILLAFFPNTLLQEVKKLDFSKDGFDDF